MSSYKVLALISGGKDSCYSMIQCVSAGHQIVGLANLRPNDEEGKDNEIPGLRSSLAENMSVFVKYEGILLLARRILVVRIHIFKCDIITN